MGYDREGNVIGVQALGYACPKALSFCGRVSDLYRLTIHETVLIYQLVRYARAFDFLDGNSYHCLEKRSHKVSVRGSSKSF